MVAILFFIPYKCKKKPDELAIFISKIHRHLNITKAILPSVQNHIYLYVLSLSKCLTLQLHYFGQKVFK